MRSPGRQRSIGLVAVMAITFGLPVSSTLATPPTPPIADITFGGGLLPPGQASFALPSNRSGEVDEIMPLADGRVLEGGDLQDASRRVGFWVARLLSDGSLDTTYGINGITQVLTYDPAGSTFGSVPPSMVAIGGRVVVAADVNTDAEALFGLTADGALDTSFGVAGTGRVDLVPGIPLVSAFGRRLAVDSTHHLYALVGGHFVLRYDSAGVIDPTYSTPGLLGTSVSPPYHGAIAVAPNDSLVIFYQSNFLGGDNASVTRLLPDGSFDPAFVPEFSHVLQALSRFDVPVDVAIAPDGAIVLDAFRSISDGGPFTTLRRLDPNGRDSAVWGYAATLQLPYAVPRVLIGTDSSVATLETVFKPGIGPGTDAEVRRYLPTGELDAAFNATDTPGSARESLSGRPIVVSAMATDAQHRLLIGGEMVAFAPTAPWLARLVPGPAASALPFFPLVPSRLMDTRAGASTVDGLFAGIGVRTARSVTTLQVTGRAGVPTGARAVVLNVTVTEPLVDGFVTAYPCDGGPLPNASNVNYVAGQTVANAVLTKTSAAGTVCVFTSQVTHLVVDVNGVHSTTASYQPLQPARLMDTRRGSFPVGATVDGLYASIGLRASRSTTVLQITGRGGVPVGAAAVSLNVTVTEPTAPGFVTVYPCDAALPNASNVNFVRGQTVANAVIVRVSAAGTVCVFTTQRTQLVVDVGGSYVASADYGPLVPRRLMDTRPGEVTFDGQFQGIGLRAEKTVTELQVAGRGGVAANASAVVLNVTVTEPTAPGFVTVYPCGAAVPNVSNVNFTTGQTVANAVVVRTSPSGTVCLFTWEPTHLVVDVNGAFAPAVG